jgi:hypothetical protein
MTRAFQQSLHPVRGTVTDVLREGPAVLAGQVAHRPAYVLASLLKRATRVGRGDPAVRQLLFGRAGLYRGPQRPSSYHVSSHTHDQ